MGGRCAVYLYDAALGAMPAMGARTPKALKVYDELEMYRASCSWLGVHDYIL
jgi:hypothetical protein